jgi:hypothetical protein
MAGTPLKANTSGRATDQSTSGSLWIGFGIGIGILILVFILLVGLEIWLTKSGPNAITIK